MSYIEVSNTNEILAGRTKHVEVHEVEILLANVDGKFYAVSDRCGHQNAPLSKGELEGKIITCPLHPPVSTSPRESWSRAPSRTLSLGSRGPPRITGSTPGYRGDDF